MKVPPKRKGNPTPPAWTANQASALNESPSEKEGKYQNTQNRPFAPYMPSMKVPPKRKGNQLKDAEGKPTGKPSMKVPPKRKGNVDTKHRTHRADMPSMKVPPKRKGNSADGLQNILLETLNESPSEKEGKFRGLSFRLLPNGPSMKVPPKRKGNCDSFQSVRW